MRKHGCAIISKGKRCGAEIEEDGRCLAHYRQFTELPKVGTDGKFTWKDFLVFIRRKYYPKANLKELSLILREKLAVTQEMVYKGQARFTEDDFSTSGITDG